MRTLSLRSMQSPSPGVIVRYFRPEWGWQRFVAHDLPGSRSCPTSRYSFTL